MDTVGGTAAVAVVGHGAHSLQLPAEAPPVPAEAPPGSLDGFDQISAARRLSVLEADKELVNRLMWRGYTGPEWRSFAAALAEYGFQVIRVWVLNGVIFRRCEQKGIAGLWPVPRDSDDSTELACETVSEGIRAFRKKVLIPGRWDPTRGATLKTFFIGQCLFQFPNVYRRWMRESQPVVVDQNSLAEELATARTLAAPVPMVAELRRALQRLSPDSPQAMEALVEMGYSQGEISELLGTTLRAVESKLYRHRRRNADSERTISNRSSD
jgi:DNA-directed RNA polymerase specialized sigma24 family protein